MLNIIIVHRPEITVEQAIWVKRIAVETAAFVFNAASVTPDTGINLNKALTADNRIVVAFGGDGTFATATRLAVDLGAKVIGVQAGNLNFLNPFDKSISANDLFNWDVYKVSKRTTGVVKSLGYRFTNDAVFKTARGTGEFVIKDHRNRYITSFRGDGVVIATAMGSTAYNLSLGGPILHPTADMFVITPIAPMSLSSRPIVVPAEELTVSIKQPENAECFMDVTFDGISVSSEKELTVGPGPLVDVLLPNDYSFYEQTKEKLGWNA